MITLYTLDPTRDRVTQMQADVVRRHVEEVTPSTALQSVQEFAHFPPTTSQHGNPSPLTAYQETSSTAPETKQTVESLMVSPLISLEGSRTREDGLNEMTRHGIHHLVITENHTVIGLLSERNLMKSSPGVTLKSLCQPYLVGHPGLLVSALALTLLTTNHSACLIRTATGLTAIVTYHDLLKALLPPLPERTA